MTTVMSPAPDPALDRASDAPLDQPGPSLRQQVEAAGRTLDRVLAAADDQVAGSRGTLGALLDLLEVIDTAQAAAVELAGRVERDGVAERDAGLSLDALLAFRSRLTAGDRRMLTRSAELLVTMPNLEAAWHAGVLGFGVVRAICVEAGRLTRDERVQLDQAFTDRDRLGRMDPDRLVDAVRGAVARLRPQDAERRELRAIEQRFLHVQPALDGALTLYGELDPDAGATLLSALDAAAGPPTPDHDVTANAADGPDDDDLDALGRPRPRLRARQRADALFHLAEAFLAGARPDGTTRRPKARVLVWTDIQTLTGDDEQAAASRLLWNLPGGPVAVTPTAARRLAENATWQFVLHDHGQVLGVSAPTDDIPARVRVAVVARDQGCRFPGCSAPQSWCDTHHVVGREAGGPTTVENLVLLCRRHHTAVTHRRWQLDMTADGTVTVRRGRHTTTSDPPHRRTIRPRDPDD